MFIVPAVLFLLGITEECFDDFQQVVDVLRLTILGIHHTHEVLNVYPLDFFNMVNAVVFQKILLKISKLLGVVVKRSRGQFANAAVKGILVHCVFQIHTKTPLSTCVCKSKEGESVYQSRRILRFNILRV